MSEGQLEYFISAKGHLLVVVLLGPLNSKTTEKLEVLAQELSQTSEASVFIFNIRDVPEISGDAVQVFAQIQKDVRARAAEFRLCGIKPELKAKLLIQGVIRTSEVFDNLQAAVVAPLKLNTK